ncbi:SPFH domain-containing protein [Pseudoroseomonas wenyumeiae]
MRRLYLETMEEILRKNPKIVVDDRLQGIVPYLPLEGQGAAPQRAPQPPAQGAAQSTPPAPPAMLNRQGSRPMNRLTLLAGVAVVAVVAIASTLFTVQQTEQVMITQFGQPIRVISKPGLHAKIPFIQTVVSFDRRLLDYDAPGEEVILGDQRRLIVDSFTRFRISDPLRFFQTSGAQEAGIRGGCPRSSRPRCAACWAASRCWGCSPPTGRRSWMRSSAR